MTRALASVLALVLAAGMAAAQELGTEEQRQAGRALYDTYCAQCHGDAGDGKGHATLRVKPQPRDFTAGKYKIRTTPSGSLPTDDDLRKVIREGLPYTSMPGWPAFSDRQVDELIYWIKTYSPDFANPERQPEPIDIPPATASSDESIARGAEIYVELGCGGCHGELGRGDGTSAPTLVDDWGQHIRPADMTMRWTFRGGPTAEDIFRTFSTGLNGTPMPSYADSLQVEDRWHLVNYIRSLAASDTPDYADLLRVAYVGREVDLADPAALDELFAGAPEARFPLIGQIVEPGRSFFPATTSLVARAVYNPQEIAIELRWNDMRAETAGRNGPDLAVPIAEEQETLGGVGAAPDEATGEEDFWGVGEAEAAPAEPATEEDFWGVEAEPEAAAGDDFWGEGEAAAAPTGPDTEFSDAVAIQLPQVLPVGIRKPYFIFGDAQSPVDLWFVDLATKRVATWVGRGSSSVVATPGDDIETVATFDRGQWRVVFKRSLRSATGVTFAPQQFVPVAFSVWDGFHRERGNKRALSRWLYLYLEPSGQVSVVGPMVRAAIVALVIELLIVFLVRRWHARRRVGIEPEPSGAVPGVAR
jgi:mono/diheme cytochrome c family protein